MSRPRSSFLLKRPVKNRRRERPSFREVLRDASRRAHEGTNRRLGLRQGRSMHAVIAESAMQEEEDYGQGLVVRMMRWLAGLLLLPLCVVTMWTFITQFSDAALHRGYWQTSAFWYFATGVLLMAGWFFTGLGRGMFLFLYVLGHELTHALFVVICRGRVTGFHASTEGGYITTDKSNLFIALSPYFVPLWTLSGAGIFWALRVSCNLPPYSENVLFWFVGFTWTFHVLWTLWMIIRDQPDLQEQGNFFSLVFIYLANLLVLVAMLCAASGSEYFTWAGFGHGWLRNAAATVEGTLTILRSLSGPAA
jgi:hypothetical protein